MNKLKKEILEWIKSLVFAIVVVTAINVFFAPTMVYSESMYPTLVEKDLLVLKRGEIVEKGDIVSFESDLYLTEYDINSLNPLQKLLVSTNTHKNLIKRVIAVPGDSILIENEKVYVNGVELEEPYISSATTGTVSIEKIPEGEYFLMGDNRSNSFDSRNTEIGTISKERIIGKVLVRLYPFNKIGVIN